MAAGWHCSSVGRWHLGGTVAGLRGDMHDISRPWGDYTSTGGSCYSEAQNSSLVFQIWKIFPDLFQMEAGNVYCGERLGF